MTFSRFSQILPNAVFYSPNAPQKCEMGGMGYQWFPINQKNDGSLDLNAKNEILNSVKLINRYIDEIELDTGISTTSSTTYSVATDSFSQLYYNRTETGTSSGDSKSTFTLMEIAG